MTRIAILARHPRRSLTALATLVAAGAVVVGSGAVFSTQTANPSNTFASGILSQTNSKSGSAILTMDHIIPGSKKTGTVDIANSGNVSGIFTLAETDLVDQDSTDATAGNGTTRSGANKLSDALHLVVQDCGAYVGATAPTCPADSDEATGQKYSGALSGVGGGLALSTYTAAEKHTYKFSVSLPDHGTVGLGTLSDTSVGGSGDNAFSGAFTSATFRFNAVSS
jgi:spore coat-associated protein N